MSTEDISAGKSKKEEIVLYFILTFIIIPAITVGLVGAYGFIVWIIQLIAGPPGH